MTTKADFRKHWRVVASTTPRLLLFITTFLFLLLTGMRVADRTTFAGNTVGSFEIDGNLTVDHLVPPSPRSWMGRGPPMTFSAGAPKRTTRAVGFAPGEALPPRTT